VSTTPVPGSSNGVPVETTLLSPERDFDIQYYADLLWRRRILLLAAAVGGLALGVLAGELQPSRYQARTLLQVMPPNPTSLGVTDALVSTGNPIRDRQFFNTQLNVLKSRSIAERVVEKLKLADQGEFRSSTDPAGLFLTHVTVEPVPDTYVVEVRVANHDPKDAALWANTLSDIYMDYSLEGQVEAAQRAYKWVNERLAETQADMEKAQDKLLKSYQGQDLFVPEGSVSAITTSITKLNEDHIQAQARRIELEAELAEFADMRRKGKPDAIPQVGQDETVSQINGRIQSLTLDLARLREKYKEGHPEVQKIQVQITQLQKDKKARVAQIEESLRAEYRQLTRREADLKSAIEAHKARAAEQSLKLTELESLKKQADSSAGLYTVLLQKLNETNIAASIQNNNVRLLDRAVVPTQPVWPRKRQLALVSLLAGLLLGAGFVLLRDALDNTIKDADDVERRLHVELLATIPRYTHDDTSLATEAYQNLRTALLFSRRGERGQVVLVTGAAPGEGKTTTLLNLGRLLAAAGESTVVIDCDLRRANLHLRLNVPREPGFTDFFVSPLELSGLIRSTRHKNLWVIPAGPLPPNPPALLARPELSSALDQLRRHFRWILVDSPPVAAVTDALLLAHEADSTVLVVQQNRIDRTVVKRALNSLRKVTPRVAGAVLNAVDVKTKAYYGYAYYGRKRSDRRKEEAARRHSGTRAHRGAPKPAEVSDGSIS
jgi:succinoglycan biosynthesis transport protein ExoP